MALFLAELRQSWFRMVSLSHGIILHWFFLTSDSLPTPRVAGIAEIFPFLPISCPFLSQLPGVHVPSDSVLLSQPWSSSAGIFILLWVASIMTATDSSHNRSLPAHGPILLWCNIYLCIHMYVFILAHGLNKENLNQLLWWCFLFHLFSGLKLNFFNHFPWGPVNLKFYWPAKYSTVPLFSGKFLVIFKAFINKLVK